MDFIVPDTGYFSVLAMQVHVYSEVALTVSMYVYRDE